MHYEFDQDLVDGQRAEDEFAALVVEKYGVEDLGKNYTNSHDRKFKGKHGIFTVEVKCDFRSSETGNAAVEFESRGKASGIAVTKADYWVFKFGKYFYILPVYRLKQLIESKHYVGIRNGGDKGSGTRMYLFSLRDFQRHTTKI